MLLYSPQKKKTENEKRSSHINVIRSLFIYFYYNFILSKINFMIKILYTYHIHLTKCFKQKYISNVCFMI